MPVEANVAAIQALQTLEAGQRQADATERSQLLRFTGWGSLPAAFGLWWLLLPMLALGIWLYARDGRVAKAWWRR